MSTASPYIVREHIASDGYRWRYRFYEPPGPARAHVVGIHGIQSHGGWYEHSCTRLSRAGYAVSFLDRRGSGLNDVDRGDAPNFRRILDDIAEYLRTLPRPVFLMAISWGGKLAVALQRRHPGLANGLALLCPGFVSLVRPTRKQRLGIVWARFVSPRKLFPVPLSEPDLFTATPRWQEFIRTDPRAVREATARLLIESVRLDGYLRFSARHVRVPVLLLLAEHDQIIANAPIRRYVESFATPDKKVIEYAEAHHTLEFEPDPECFIDDVLMWLDERMKAEG